MANFRDSLHVYRYIDDGNLSWKCRLTTSVAAAGGFGDILSAGEQAAMDRWPGGRRTMRGVTIKTSNNRWHDFLPIGKPDYALFLNGGEVLGEIGGRSGWFATGKSGENKHL